jgi:hypothetical protein
MAEGFVASAAMDDELRALQSKEAELAAENAKLAQEIAELKSERTLQQLALDADANAALEGSPFEASDPFEASTLEASPFEASPFETLGSFDAEGAGAYYPPMSPTDATAKGSPTVGSAGSPFHQGELFFEPEASNSVTDPSVANPFLPDSSQGDVMANPFLQGSSQGDGRDEVRSTDANNDIVRHDTILEVPEDREAEIGEFVARLVASLILTAVISVSNELDKAFNDEVSNEGDKLMTTAILSGEPSSLLFTATEEMSPAQAAEKSSLYEASVLDEEEDSYGGLGLARRSLQLATDMVPPEAPAPGRPDVSGLDLESYDEEFEADSP